MRSARAMMEHMFRLERESRKRARDAEAAGNVDFAISCLTDADNAARLADSFRRRTAEEIRSRRRWGWR